MKHMIEPALPIFFLTTDPLRGLGLEQQVNNFHLICIDYTDTVDLLLERGVNVLCYEKDLGNQNEIPRNTRTLLENAEVQQYILDHSQNQIGLAMFKPNFNVHQTLKNSSLFHNREVISANTAPAISNKLENKLFSRDFFQKHQLLIPPSEIDDLHTANYQKYVNLFGSELVVQFDRGWFGNHTFFVHNKDEWDQLATTYTNRPVKIAHLVNGVTLTNNAVVSEQRVWQTYPFLQINETQFDETPLARYQGSTIGNSWMAEPGQIVTSFVADKIATYTEKIGLEINKQGFNGFFGLDFIVDDQDTVYVQEINPRFTASAQMISQLENQEFGSSLLYKHFETFGLLPTIQTPLNAYCQPLKANRVVARHTETTPFLIEHQLNSGLYQIGHDGTYTFQRPAYSLDEITQKDQCLIFFVKSGREVTVDQELLQIQTKDLAAEQLINLAKRLKKHLLGN